MRARVKGRLDTGRAAALGMSCAAAMIALQVGAKAARDALFLSTFPVTALPGMLVASAVVSVALVLLSSRTLARRGPGRCLPLAFASSAVLFLVEWGLARRVPRGVAVAVYLHVASFGSILISAFWLLASERFDPRTARRTMARIAAAGTAGGLLGGLLAARVAAHSGVPSVLLLLAGLSLVCAATVLFLRTASEPAAGTARAEEHGVGASPFTQLQRTPYSRAVAAFVLTASVAATIADYLFKQQAVAAYPEAAALMRFFAVFYAGVGVLTLGVQMLATRVSLDRLGLAGTLATMPGAVAAAAMLSALLPGALSVSLLRAAEAVLRGSLHRVAYELLYTPLPPMEKRSTKTFVDVVVERLGDVVGGVLVRAAILLAPSLLVQTLSLTVLGLGLLTLWLCRELKKGYVDALERSLLTRAVALDAATVLDSTTRAAMLRVGTGQEGAATTRALLPPVLGAADPMETGFVLALAARESSSPVSTVESATHRSSSARPADRLVGRLQRLRSGQLQTVRAALLEESPIDALLIPQVARLLAWDEICEDAQRALRRAAATATGQLVDALLDPAQEFSIRRRIACTLVDGQPERAVDGLVRGLRDQRFEVRVECGRALARLHEEKPEVAIPERTVVEAVIHEAEVDLRVWEGRRLLDEGLAAASFSLVEDFVRERSSRSLEHVFVLLSLVLPAKPLRIAFRALHTDDAGHRGTALEYLDSVLPPPVRERLWPFLADEGARPGPARDGEEALRDLIGSSASIELRLAELRRAAAASAGIR